MAYQILGIDPGSRNIGYGLVCMENKHLTYKASGCIRVGHIACLPSRLAVIFQDIQSLLQTFHPSVMAIEQIFLKSNPMSALTLGHARGAIIAAVAHQHIPIVEYAAKVVKMHVSGYGSADKNQVAYMVQKHLNMSSKPKSLDASDALAVAICHAAHGCIHGVMTK